MICLYAPKRTIDCGIKRISLFSGLDDHGIDGALYIIMLMFKDLYVYDMPICTQTNN